MQPSISPAASFKIAAPTHTETEIAAQPEIWEKIFNQILRDETYVSEYIQNALPEISRIILTGAGTSAFIGLSLQGVFSRSMKIHADAVPTTDLVTHPGNYFFSHETIMLVSFARSGNSPESTAVVELADNLCRKCFHIIITCDATGNLAKYKSGSTIFKIVLPPEANDKGLAMTGSYSGMLLCGYLVAKLKEIGSMNSKIRTLQEYGKKILVHYSPGLKEVASMGFNRVVFLGSGPFFGTATESHLKLQELTDGNIICKMDSYLGFRHGPKAVTNEKTLLVFIFSNNKYVQQYEIDLVISMKKGKTPLYTIGISEAGVNGIKPDLDIQLSDSGNHLDEELLTVCAILPAQLLGLYKSQALGLNPDAPSASGAISRIVEDVSIYKY